MYQELGTNWVQIVVALKLSFPVLIGLLRVPQSEAPLLYKIKKGALKIQKTHRKLELWRNN